VAGARRLLGPLLCGTFVAAALPVLAIGIGRARPLVVWFRETRVSHTPPPAAAGQAEKRWATATEAIPTHIAGLSDRDPRLRSRAAADLGVSCQALVVSSSPKPDPAHRERFVRAVEALRTALHDPDRSVREASAGALGLCGPSARSAADDLFRALEDPSWDIRLRAAHSLVRIDRQASAQVIAKLLDSIKKPSFSLGRRGVILELIREVAPGAEARAAQAIASWLRHEERDVRLEAVDLLSLIGPRATPILPTLEAMLGDPDRMTRICAAMAILRIKQKGEGRPLAIVLETAADPTVDFDVRFDVLDTIVEVARDHERDVIPAMIECIRHGKVKDHRQRSMSLLKRFTLPTQRMAVPALLEVWHDPDPEVAEWAVDILWDVDEDTAAREERKTTAPAR
jgi:hypothetical protein